MDDVELEQFCRQWVDRKSGYIEVYRYAASGDKGRDIVGFVTNNRHDGDWDNYQCKQYRKKLDVCAGLLAVGKVLYWASQGEFTVPRRFYFVAPRALNGKLLRLIDRPAEFKQTLIDRWDDVCAKNIVARQRLPFDQALSNVVDAFQFNRIIKISIDEIMDDPATIPLLFEHFGADPGEYPPGTVPPDIAVEEMKYLRAMLDAYGEREKTSYPDVGGVFAHPTHGPDLKMHRESYFEADAFQKFYRDNTSPKVIEAFRRDIRFGIKDKLKAPAADSLARVEAVMTQAAAVAPAGPLQKYAYVPVKQGVCHHLVNDDEITWTPP